MHIRCFTIASKPPRNINSSKFHEHAELFGTFAYNVENILYHQSVCVFIFFQMQGRHFYHLPTANIFICVYMCECMLACLRGVPCKFWAGTQKMHFAHLRHRPPALWQYTWHSIRVCQSCSLCCVCVCVLQRTPEKFIAFGTPPPPPPNQPTLRPAHQDVFHLFHLYFFFCRQPCAVA